MRSPIAKLVTSGPEVPGEGSRRKARERALAGYRAMLAARAGETPG